jgi:hypothetical protein
VHLARQLRCVPNPRSDKQLATRLQWAMVRTLEHRNSMHCKRCR